MENHSQTLSNTTLKATKGTEKNLQNNAHVDLQIVSRIYRLASNSFHLDWNPSLSPSKNQGLKEKEDQDQNKERKALTNLSELNQDVKNSINNSEFYTEEVKIGEDQENDRKEAMDRKFAKIKERIAQREVERERQKLISREKPMIDSNHEERAKIQTYFRYRVGSLTKIIEERVTNLGILNKATKPKAGPKGKGGSQAGGDSNYNKELREEVWKNLRRYVSTKSKYKYRDFVNFQKKVNMAMKTLFPANYFQNSSNKNNALNLELEDEQSKHDEMNKGKSKPVDLEKLSQFKRLRTQNPFAKVFIINGVYPDLKKALEARGWIENPQVDSMDFNYIWALKRTEINYDELKSNQYVNHFEKNTSITTKYGLARNIRNLIWHENDDPDKFYPRCYDLNDVQEFDDFIEEFKFGEAMAMLRMFSSLKKISQSDKEEEVKLWKLRTCLALDICQRRMKPIEVAVEDTLKGKSMMVSQEEWEIMARQETNEVFKDGKYKVVIKSLESHFGFTFDSLSQNSKKEEEQLLLQANEMLNKLEASFPQVRMNQGKNIWIIKPAGLSRGRGIRCYDDLGEILEHVRIKDSEWVAQKYIENPLIIKNRKFDIRQWVLVTSWDPLTIWFYDECYVRFTAQEFNPDDLTNKFAHLTNNSISKKLDTCETSEIEGNMWTLAEFRSYLVLRFQETFGKDEFQLKIQDRMKDMVIKSLKSVQDMVESRVNSFELYGYDFMIDEDCNPWLIEINSSPTMEYSTSVTTRLVKMVMEDCIKVTVDYGMSKSKDKKNINTGCFKCICPKNLP